MQYQFSNLFLDQNELFNQPLNNISPFLLENNKSQIEKIYNFYRSDINLLYVNGFLGTGKVDIINYSINFLSAETIVLKYNCFNSTILDDILLSFFVDFKKLADQKLISEPRTKTENFTQKINSYFANIEKSFVVIIDSFEEILEENRQEILDFIFHLNSMEKVKIIIIGRTFESKYFNNVRIERVTTTALEKQIFDKYLKSEKIKASSGVIEEFYKHTRGYYLFTTLSIKLMKKEELSLVDFLINLKNSYLPLDKFLEKQSLKLIPQNEKNLFLFLATIRHSVSIDLLKKINLCNEENIKTLVENLIITTEDSKIFVQDYFKEEADSLSSPGFLQKVHQYIIDLYSTQLPLKPLERDICVSRQTMRKEIEYHNFFLPKKPKLIENPALDINYLSYSKVFTQDEKSLNENFKATTEEKAEPIQIDLPQKKNIQINLENLPFQQQEQKKEQTKKYINYENKSSFDEKDIVEPENLSLNELIELAKQAEKHYNYQEVIELYKKAILKTGDANYKNNLPVIYTKIAFAYQKSANHEKALNYYTMAHDFYKESQDFVKMNYIKFNMAKIFYDTYKIDNAKTLFTEITQSQSSPPSLLIKSHLQLANLEDNLSNSQDAIEYYKKALMISDNTIPPEILSELYFKYALTADDKNDTQTAIEFYDKCIKLTGNTKVNKFLSPAYSNIATLYLEKNDTNNAILNYKKAYGIDKQNNNLEGVYYSSSKLASILQRRQPEEALEYLNIALNCAKLIKDIFYIVSANLAIGDFYYDKNQNEFALKYYINALDLAQNNFSKDNINKINLRINDIKFRVGAEKFENLVEIIREQME